MIRCAIVFYPPPSGHRGGDDCMLHPQAPFYLEDVTDASLRALAQHCPCLKCAPGCCELRPGGAPDRLPNLRQQAWRAGGRE